jgi:hypothetical protein
MALAENTSARITYKAYATGAITANTQPTSSSDPAATGGQILRRVSCSLDLAKDTYQSAEIRQDKQVQDFRHGVKRVTGSISGELSPKTYFDFIEAACRGTKNSSAVAKTEAELTSAAADSTTSKFTFGGGNPVTEGLRVGHVVRFTNLSEAANNSKNFVILGFSGSNLRDMTVYPAPTTMTADVAFSVTTVGKTVYVPSTGHVSRKFAVEVAHIDLDLHRLFTECRVGGIQLQLPPTGMATIEIPMMGRDMETAEGASSPFFTAPTDQTTTGILAAVNGLIRVGGSNVGVVTGMNLNLDLQPSADPVVGQNFVPEIFLGRANVSGQVTAFFQDLTMVNYFKNETEVELLAYLTASNVDAADAMVIYIPKVKFGDADIGLQGEAGIPISMPFTGLKPSNAATVAGIDQSVIQFTDTAAS